MMKLDVWCSKCHSLSHSCCIVVLNIFKFIIIITVIFMDHYFGTWFLMLLIIIIISCFWSSVHDYYLFYFNCIIIINVFTGSIRIGFPTWWMICNITTITLFLWRWWCCMLAYALLYCVALKKKISYSLLFFVSNMV